MIELFYNILEYFRLFCSRERKVFLAQSAESTLWQVELSVPDSLDLTFLFEPPGEHGFSPVFVDWQFLWRRSRSLVLAEHDMSSFCPGEFAGDGGTMFVMNSLAWHHKLLYWRICWLGVASGGSVYMNATNLRCLRFWAEEMSALGSISKQLPTIQYRR